MAKNIVLLSDGPGNCAGECFKTKVWRLYQAVDLAQTDDAGKPVRTASAQPPKPNKMLGFSGALSCTTKYFSEIGPAAVDKGAQQS